MYDSISIQPLCIHPLFVDRKLHRKIAPFHFRLPFEILYCFDFLCRFFLRKDSKIYTMQCRYLLLASGSKIAIDFVFAISILQLFFPSFLHLIHFVIPWGSSLTDSIPVRPLSGHSFNLWLFWSHVVVAVVPILFFRVYLCVDMVNFKNLFPIHLFETALFFAFICFLNDSVYFFSAHSLLSSRSYHLLILHMSAPNACCFYYNFETFAYALT